MTRIQKERFENLSEYERVKGAYVINEDFLKGLKKKITILHPLPRVDEISREWIRIPGLPISDRSGTGCLCAWPCSRWSWGRNRIYQVAEKRPSASFPSAFVAAVL